MNTPRDLLFARHQAAIPKLDALRRDVVAGLGAARRRGQTSLAAGLLPLLWRELIRPCRQTWTALAAVWVVLFIVNAAQRDGASACRGQSPPPVAMCMTYPNQEKMLNELLADRFPPAEADRPKTFTPKPRSATGGRFAV